MLVPGHNGASLVVCATCRAPSGAAGGGAALLAALRAAAGTGDVAVETMACLWTCGQGASVQLRAPGKIGYVMGGFDASAAGDLLAFARVYAASADGEVAFAAWPPGVLGHFIARVPPPGMLAV